MVKRFSSPVPVPPVATLDGGFVLFDDYQEVVSVLKELSDMVYGRTGRLTVHDGRIYDELRRIEGRVEKVIAYAAL